MSETRARSANRGSAVNTDTDRFPTPTQGLRRIIQEADLPETPIESLEVRFLASGEVTYRYRAPREEETQGGYLGVP